MKKTKTYKDSLRGKLHSFCPGCGHIIFSRIFVSVLDELISSGWEKPENICFFGGIGCGALIGSQYRYDNIHTMHGRVLPIATGFKLANPKSKVIVISGDGDLAEIGGNHLKAAIHRNIPIKVFCLNNFCYGMTGGQLSNATYNNAITRTTVMGNPYDALNFKDFIFGCGGRYFSLYPVIAKELRAGIMDLLLNENFTFMDVHSLCVTYFVKLNPNETKRLRTMYISRDDAKDASLNKLKDKIIYGKWERDERGVIK